MARRKRYRLLIEQGEDGPRIAGISPARGKRLRGARSGLTVSVLDRDGRETYRGAILQQQCCAPARKSGAAPPPPLQAAEVLAWEHEAVRLAAAANPELISRLRAVEDRRRPLPSAPGDQVKAVARAIQDKKWVVVALANGFSQGNMQPFRNYVALLRDRLGSAKPFREFEGRIEVLGIETPSVDDTLGPDSAFGHGMEVLDAEREWFLITVDQAAVKHFLEKHRIYADRVQPLVVSNTDLYGGSGGEAAVVSLDENAIGIGIHEIGHSEFSLSDEYWTPVERPERYTAGDNVCEGAERLKWSPTMPQPRVPFADSEPPRKPPPLTDADYRPDEVGAFEGAFYRREGFYRPQFRCRMRSMDEEFCVVCQDLIRKRLRQLTK